MRDGPAVIEGDAYDRELVANVHPPGWTNPTPAPRYNLVVIGGGTAGLVTAAGAAGLGARVALIERSLLGGDCLNVGCVPSKTLIRSSRVRREVDDAPALGFTGLSRAEADFAAVMERVRRVRALLSHHDSAQRFTGLGVDVFLGSGRFTGRDTAEVSGETLRFAKAVIATGARAARPDIDGLESVGYHTNETVFTLTERPKSLAVIGGGPIGCELAQAFARLGCEVTILHSGDHLLDREDPDAAAIVQERFVREGIRLVLGAKVLHASREGGRKALRFRVDGKDGGTVADEILVGAGRAPNVEGLGLDAAGVEHDPKRGVRVDDHLRTTNPRIFACGDACLEQKFTHAADASARIVIQNALFFGRKRVSALTIPWVTYTDPEVAHVGLYERDARARNLEVTTFVRSLAEVDRAIADGETEGFVKVHVRKGSDTIVGATIVARHAGEMIGEVAVAMAAGVGLGKLASVIHPYPTQAEAIRQVGDLYNRTRLTPRVKRLLEWWLVRTR